MKPYNFWWIDVDNIVFKVNMFEEQKDHFGKVFAKDYENNKKVKLGLLLSWSKKLKIEFQCRIKLYEIAPIKDDVMTYMYR